MFPGAKGSSGWSAYFHMTRLNGVAPKALIFNKMTTKVALGAVVTHAPAMTELDQDPLKVIETGDWVKVDADNGLVEVTKKKSDFRWAVEIAVERTANFTPSALASASGAGRMGTSLRSTPMPTLHLGKLR